MVAAAAATVPADAAASEGTAKETVEKKLKQAKRKKETNPVPADSSAGFEKLFCRSSTGHAGPPTAAVTDVSENIESGNMGVEETPNTQIGAVIEDPPESQKGELSAERENASSVEETPGSIAILSATRSESLLPPGECKEELPEETEHTSGI